LEVAPRVLENCATILLQDSEHIDLYRYIDKSLNMQKKEHSKIHKNSFLNASKVTFQYLGIK
jgi:hypothetical protein